MNEAITEYEDELNTRITSEQLPLSERTDSFIPNTKSSFRYSGRSFLKENIQTLCLRDRVLP